MKQEPEPGEAWEYKSSGHDLSLSLVVSGGMRMPVEHPAEHRSDHQAVEQVDGERLLPNHSRYRCESTSRIQGAKVKNRAL